MGGLHLVFSDQRLNYIGSCVFEDILLVQEEDLLLVIFFLYKKRIFRVYLID